MTVDSNLPGSKAVHAANRSRPAERSSIGPVRRRYAHVADAKAVGATFTPKNLSDFVAKQIVGAATAMPKERPIRLFDPAVGDGQLLLSLLEQLDPGIAKQAEVHGFETNPRALQAAKRRIQDFSRDIPVRFESRDFLEFVLEAYGDEKTENLLLEVNHEPYDLIIANPPYVRTQIMGAKRTRELATKFRLAGRVDLYHPFLLGIGNVLHPEGVAGIIVSNRFMTTKSGTSIRRQVLERFEIEHVWDLGDTKLFSAAVLPAVLLAKGKNGNTSLASKFTSIYATDAEATAEATDVIDALSQNGVVQTPSQGRFLVKQGKLRTNGTADGVWRIETSEAERWLATVAKHQWGRFKDIGKVRVGVKTCADKVFIRDDWQFLESERPELVRPLITHHMGQRFKAKTLHRPKEILYPHVTLADKRKPIYIDDFPKSKKYLERHRETLESRKYLIDSGRKWYELWVPQNPAAWSQPKIVFRDISKRPTFWMDLSGAIVNGDCYWLTCSGHERHDLLWLAVSVANSSFIERFYDLKFNNRLYAGRRRFMTQYVENFPLPDPESKTGQEIIRNVKKLFDHMPAGNTEKMEKSLDRLVWRAFGLAFEE